MTSAFTRVLGCKALINNHTVSKIQMHFRLPFPERYCTLAFPGGSVVKDLPLNAGDVGLIPGLHGSSGEGNGKPLQYSCLRNPTDRGVWLVTVYGAAKSLT